MVKLEMGIWAGIAAGGIMLMLIVLPVLGCIFSRRKKAKKAVDMEESTAEKGTLVVEAAPAPTSPVNAILQKSNLNVSQYEIGDLPIQSSTQGISPSYRSQGSTSSPLRNSTPSLPYMQPMWTKPSP